MGAVRIFKYIEENYYPSLLRGSESFEGTDLPENKI
jgi:hypothetical protein